MGGLSCWRFWAEPGAVSTPASLEASFFCLLDSGIMSIHRGSAGSWKINTSFEHVDPVRRAAVERVAAHASALLFLML